MRRNRSRGGLSGRRRQCPALWLPGAALVAALGGCSAVEPESAYASERYLCGEEQGERWRLELEQCRIDHQVNGSCAGVMSLTGRLHGEPLTVDSRLEVARFEDVVGADGVRLRNEIKLNGLGPYFHFRIRLWEVGGELGAQPALEVIAGQAPGAEPRPLRDSFVRASFRLSAAGKSVESPAAGGYVSLPLHAESEQAGIFRFQFGSDQIDGCFHALLTEYSLTRGAP
jgi:hypothetical protein